MEINSITENDLQNLNKLYNISKDIMEIYQKLIFLEINGGKDTEQYQIIVDKLKEMIFFEDKIYNNFDLDFCKCLSLQEYIKKTYLSKRICEDILIDGIIDSFEYRRVYYMINYIGNLKMNSLNDLSLLGIKVEQISFNPNNSTNMLDKEVSLLMKLSNALDDDYYGSFIMFLEDDINNEINMNNKRELIYRKFYSIYFYKSIERIMIENNFIFPNQIYSNSRMIYSFLNRNKDEDLTGSDIYFLSHFEKLINKYLYLSEHDMHSDKEVDEKIIECMFKSKIANITKSTSDKLYEFINNSKELSKLATDNNNIYKLIEIINNSKQFRERIGLITFGIKM